MRTAVLFAICLSFFLITRVVAHEDELRLIQKAIEEKDASWVAGVTSVSELSEEEKKGLCGLIPPTHFRAQETWNIIPTSDSAFDWRNHDDQNWMTQMKDQRQCGSCWAFGALGALEPMVKIYYDAPDVEVDFSEQYLVCCCHPSGNGCNGYSLDGTASWLRNHGVPDEECFGYLAKDASNQVYCEDRCSDWENRLRKTENWRWVPLDSAKHYLYDGPLYAGLTVYDDFMSYRGGVYEHVWGDLAGYHAVVILGWSDSDECWICKNSWGANWGEDGWFRIKWGECLWDETIAMTPAEPPYPELACIFKQVTEDDAYGDGDGIWNPGEQATLTVTLQNIGDTASGVTGILQSEDPRVTIMDSVESYGDIPPRGIRSNSHPFRLIAGEEVGRFPLRLVLRANEFRGTPYSTSFEFEAEVTLNQTGWPIAAGMTESSPAFIDIDGDSVEEIVVGCNDGNLYVKKPGGLDKENFPFTIGGRLAGSPAVGDVDGDGGLDLVIASWEGEIYVINNDGSLLRKISTESRFTATPVLSDIDGDNKLDIVIGDLAGDLHLFHHDGTEFHNFPYPSGGPILNGAAVGDLDGDGIKEIVFGNILKKVCALSRDGELLWEFPTGGWIRSEPSIADMSGLKIVIGCLDKNLYILDENGEEVTHVPTPSGIKTSPSFADLDGDGNLEIVFTSGKYLYVCREDGSEVSGWPKALDGYAQSPSISDLDGDGIPEVIVTTSSGSIYVYKADGSLLPPFPFSTGRQMQSPPVIGDLDMDGDLEIVFGDNSGLSAVDVKSSRGNDTYWNMHRGNPWRTGDYRDLFTGISEVPSSKSPRVYSLYQNYPNPFRPPTTIVYNLPEGSWVKLTVFNLLGEKVKTLVDRWEEKGCKAVRWNGRNEGNSRVAAGVYFYRIEASGYVATRKMVIAF